MHTQPFITVAIPNLNGSRWLRDAINSILSQNYSKLELIFVDGGSSDESLQIAEEYKQHFAKIIQGKDNGPGDAINKALRSASGDIFHWINSDDLLEKGALIAIADAFSNNPKSDAVLGCVTNFYPGEQADTTHYNNDHLSYKEFYRYCCGLTSRIQWHQPGCWWKIDRYLSIGGIDTRYKAYFDTELYLRLLRDNPTTTNIQSNLVRFRVHEQQISYGRAAWKKKELRKILQDELITTPSLKQIYRERLRIYYWNKRLKRYDRTSPSAGYKDVAKFCLEVAADPSIRLRPSCGTKATLQSMLSSSPKTHHDFVA